MRLDDQQVTNMLESMDNESRAIREETIRITWWMRGGINYEQAMSLSHDEKIIINKMIKENMEAAEKSGMPFW